MPVLTVRQLTTPITRAQALANVLDVLKGFGFETNSWQSGSVQRTLIEASAEVWSQTSSMIAVVARAGFNTLASGQGLTEFSDSHYDNQRKAAVPTRGKFVFTDTTGGGPHSLAAGQIVIVGPDSKTFRNATGGTVPASGSVILEVVSEVGGSLGNIVTGSSDLSLQSTIAGVTVTNPAVAPTSTWITTSGQDEEPDATLRQRNRSKWAVKSLNRPEDALIYLALDALDATGQPTGVTKAVVDSTNPQGEGSADVYLATQTGPASGPSATAGTQCYAVDQHLQKHRAISNYPLRTLAANSYPLTLSGTVYYSAAADLAVMGGAINDAVKTYVENMPIDGYEYSVGTKGISRSELIGLIATIDGVLNVDMILPAANVSLGGSFSAITLPTLPYGTPGSMTFVAL